MNIPLIDLKRQYASISETADKAVLDVLHSGQYILGDHVKKLEEEFKELSGAKYSVSCGNGTDAIVIALQALGVGPGDEVITTPYTFFATAEAISIVGAVPVFVDVEEDTYNIDPSKIEDAITEKTKVIEVVPIFGNPVKMDEIMKIAKKHDLKVVEDAAQAILAERNGKKSGEVADITTFSFFPTKNLGACGDAGMITTNDKELYTICRALRVHGSGEDGQRAFASLNNTGEEIIEEENSDNTIYNPLKYYNYLIGHNSRTDEIQAAIIREKMKKIDEWTNARIENANFYTEHLKETPLVTPTVTDNGKHVYHLYILQSEERDDLVKFLANKGIATGVYYPVPMHLQKVFTEGPFKLGYKTGDMPVAEYLSERTFAIPMFAELTDEEKEYIVESIKEFYHE